MLWKVESECRQWDSFAWKRLNLKRSNLKYTRKLGIYWPVELKKVQKYNWIRSSKISWCHFFHMSQLYIFLCGLHFQEGSFTFLERCSSSSPSHSATLGLYPTDFKIQQKILRDSRIPIKVLGMNFSSSGITFAGHMTVPISYLCSLAWRMFCCSLSPNPFPVS